MLEKSSDVQKNPHLRFVRKSGTSTMFDEFNVSDPSALFIDDESLELEDLLVIPLKEKFPTFSGIDSTTMARLHYLLNVVSKNMKKYKYI